MMETTDLWNGTDFAVVSKNTNELKTRLDCNKQVQIG